MPFATIGGVPILGNKAVEWKQTAGVEPVQMTFDIDPGFLPDLLEQAGFDKTVTLIINDGGTPHIFNNLHIVTDLPGDNPNIARVVVTDQRWLWRTKIITQRFNMRRRVGTKRRASDWEGAMQNASVDFKYHYATHTLNDGKRWIAEDILDEITRSETGLNETTTIFTAAFRNLRNLPVENLFVDEIGSEALARALSLIPGGSVTIDPETGAVVFFSTLSDGQEGKGADREILKALGPEIVDGGHTSFVTNDFTRPKAVDVYFTIESELRFDFLGDDFTETTTEDNPTRFAENVLSVPDFISIFADGQEFTQGSWVTILQALDGFGVPPFFGSKLTPKDLNKAFIPGNQVFAAIGITGKFDVGNKQDRDWSARIASLMQNYRQTFRINSGWTDRVFQYKAYLLGSLDIVSRQRAPALAFSNHFIKSSQKGRLKAGILADHLRQVR